MAMAMVQEHNMDGLERRALGPVEIFGQAVGNTGMATVVALTPVLVASSAGNGSWVSMLVAVLAMLGVGYCAALFGRRVATSGSLYTYTAQALGKGAAFLVGWALLIAYFGLAISIPMLGGEFLGQVFGQGDAVQVVLWLFLAAAATAFAVYGVRISTRTALLLEGISLTLLAVVLVATLLKSGTIVDSTQLKLEGFGLHPLFLGITLSVTALVGFESGASLGAEARDPYTAIPRVILLTVGVAGVIYILAIYIENLGFHHLGQDITAAAAPTTTLGQWAGVNFLKYPIALGLGFSFFAIMLACVNALARMLFTMAREGVAPAAFGRVHPTRRTPYMPMLLLAPFLFLTPVVMKWIANTDPLSAFAYLATPSTFGFIFAYILICVGAPVLLYRETGRVPAGVAVAAVVGIAAMIATYVANVTPVPAYPFNILPYIFLGLMAIGGLVYLWLRGRRPEAVRAIGSVEEVDEPAPPPRLATVEA
jgi:amino acid transporter